MGFYKLLAAWAVAMGCTCHEGGPVQAQADAPSRPVLKPARARGYLPPTALAVEGASAGIARGQSISGCVAGWYSHSGMTQAEWRSACERASTAQGIPQVQALSLCIVAWEPATHMTKREWRAACERSVQQDPGAFQR
jgi:hypothetical protein